MQQGAERIDLHAREGFEKRLYRREPAFQQPLAKGDALWGEKEREGASVPPFAPFDETVGDQPIDKAHHPRVRQAEDPAKLVIGRPQAVADDDERGRGFASMRQDGPRGRFDPVGDGKPEGAQKIGGAISQASNISAQGTCFKLTICASRTYLGPADHLPVRDATKDQRMTEPSQSVLSPEHADFFDRFKSFWAAPSGARVGELIAPEAMIHFSGAGSFSGADYVHAMGGMLASMEGLEVRPIDCAGNGELLYIFWNASTVIEGERRQYHGVDRFRLRDGMAIEEHVIFDPTVLQPRQGE